MAEISAESLSEQADAALERRDLESAIASLQSAAALLATMTGTEEADDRRHGDVCRRLGDALIGADRVPEAAQAYQEAADAYGRCGDAEPEAGECARLVLQSVRALKEEPQDRLYLLIARIERESRQLAQEPGTEGQQGDCAFRAATILQRRDRFADAAERYYQALNLYTFAPDTGMRRAHCHQRLAGLYQYELSDRGRAIHHYREAIRLYAQHEQAFEGEQINHGLCVMLLKQLLAE